jgi:hypothetical protein
MDLNKQKEQFSIAYVQAVVAVAGFNIYRVDVDEDSIDLGVAATGAKNFPRSPKLDLQLKCTAGDVLQDDAVHFPLKIKNYDDLRANSLTPHLLVVVLVPEDVLQWLQHSEEELIMRRCGYWMSLRNAADIDNETSVTVRLPREQAFTPEVLRQIMHKINDGESL